MSLPQHLLVHAATWLVAGTTTNDYGDTLPDWDTATSTTIAVRLQQEFRDEVSDESRDTLSQRATVWANETGISGSDRLVVGGTTWEVLGPPALVADGVGTHHVEFTVRAVSGVPSVGVPS